MRAAAQPIDLPCRLMHMLEMRPSPGERCLRFVGDRVEFALHCAERNFPAGECRAFLRTNLGRAQQVRGEIIEAYTRKLPSAAASWRDVAMRPEEGGWGVKLPLIEVGYFQAKAYLIDARGRQFWPEG